MRSASPARRPTRSPGRDRRRIAFARRLARSAPRVRSRHLRITAAEHLSARPPPERPRNRDTDEFEQRPVGIERVGVARDQRADRQSVENAAGVALNRLVVSAAGRGELGLRRRWRLIRRAESQVQHAACGRDRIDRLDFAGPFIVRRGRPADQRTRDLAESIPLARLSSTPSAGELCGGRASAGIKGAGGIGMILDMAAGAGWRRT